MSNNLAIWNDLYRTDPDHVKPITGKAYKGNSPKPQYIIMRLTEQFGPVGLGFGWEVLEASYIPGAPRDDVREMTHECRIRFWWSDGAEQRSVESYGATKALYKAGVSGGQTGYWVSDEDAAKKSLTDAIVKAASWLGAAGDIFMGRWDDSAYQAELKADKSRENVETKPAEAPQKQTPEQAAIAWLRDARSLDGLRTRWAKLGSDKPDVANNPDVEAAFYACVDKFSPFPGDTVAA